MQETLIEFKSDYSCFEATVEKIPLQSFQSSYGKNISHQPVSCRKRCPQTPSKNNTKAMFLYAQVIQEFQ